MSEHIPAYPLAWPLGRPRKTGRKDAPFKTRGSRINYVDAVKRLQKELDRIGAKDAILNSNIKTRLDGSPVLNEPISDPGVVCYFYLKGKPVAMPCDTFRTVADNVAGIAAHIEATRAIERYGVATVAEMFQGFAALPPPPPQEHWSKVLGVPADASVEAIREARNLLAKRHAETEAIYSINRAYEDALRDRGVK